MSHIDKDVVASVERMVDTVLSGKLQIAMEGFELMTEHGVGGAVHLLVVRGEAWPQVEQALVAAFGPSKESD